MATQMPTIEGAASFSTDSNFRNMLHVNSFQEVFFVVMENINQVTFAIVDGNKSPDSPVIKTLIILVCVCLFQVEQLYISSCPFILSLLQSKS